MLLVVKIDVIYYFDGKLCCCCCREEFWEQGDRSACMWVREDAWISTMLMEQEQRRACCRCLGSVGGSLRLSRLYGILSQGFLTSLDIRWLWQQTQPPQSTASRMVCQITNLYYFRIRNTPVPKTNKAASRIQRIVFYWAAWIWLYAGWYDNAW